MTWRDIDDDKIKLTQVKTGARLRIPVHPDLQAVLDGSPRTDIAILVTERGGPFSFSTYTRWFKKITQSAGLPAECASHGLRKAAARRLAEAGCSVHEVASITGHRSLKEVERYTKDADQTRMAESAIRRLTRDPTRLSRDTTKLANIGKSP